MDLLKPTTLKALCARAGMRPEKSSGQNFLIDRTALDRIVEAVDPQPHDTILEVGAGFGVLTTALAPRVARVIAIERDPRITSILRELVEQCGNVEVVEEDVLRWLRSDHDLGAAWKIAANLPYSITSDFLRLLFDAVGTGTISPPARAVLLLQREVVDRLTVDPQRTRDRKQVGMLTILTQLHATPHRVATVAPGSFWPQPKVESAVVVLDEWRSPAQIQELLGDVSRDEFLHVVHACFARRRAQMRTTVSHVIAREQGDRSNLGHDTRRPGLLRGVYPVGTRSVPFGARNDKAFWDSTGIDPTARPETLTLTQWIALARALRS
ncbi:MAG: 16S rRNA (adenine(1518)-N(6)/adenine(1519)-N(6))-dimethyltransferase RsmA [bacterium]|nr:16S rRNA (adenine(1518)-N(6)/adenine(1519)-N(6))-dimethyltransferase RsmA [bacterium]